MDLRSCRSLSTSCQCLIAFLCVASLTTDNSAVAQTSQQAQSQVITTTTNTGTEEAPKLPAEQLDSLVAPIALYPDPLLAQVLAASTYPLEIIQLQQWMDRNKNLKDKALADAVAKQPWDPSVQALAALASTVLIRRLPVSIGSISPVLRVVLPFVALASLTTVDVSVGVSVEVIIVVDVDVAVAPIAIAPGAASPSTKRKSCRAPRKPHPGVVSRIGVGVIGICGRRSSVNHFWVV